MWPICILSILIALTGYVSLGDRITNGLIPNSANSADLAINIREYRLAVLQYARSHPGMVGAVADSSLTFPSWYSRNPLWTNYVSGGTAVIYATALPNPRITSDIVKLSGNSIFAGEANAANGTLYSPVYGQTSIPLMVAVPNGAPVWIASVY